MRNVVVIAVLIGLTGCGAKEDGKASPSAAGFAIDGPGGTVEVLNGGPPVKSPIEVRWKASERDDVALSATVEPAAQGVSVTVEPAVLTGGEGTAQVVIRCAETGRPGDFKVTVTGKTAKAGTATKEILVKVPPID
jgi:hypothetical protein